MLTIGTLLPQTGSLAFLGPPEFAGFDLAIKDINDAGGVLGKHVVGHRGRLGRHHDRHRPTRPSDRLLGAERRRHHRRRLVGRVADGHRQDHGRRRRRCSRRPTPRRSCRPTPTRACTSAPPRRTSSRATCSARSSLNDGNETVAIIARNDAYGTGLAEDLDEDARRRRRRGRRTSKIVRRPKAPTFDAEVDEIAAADPDAIVVIGFDESSQILAHDGRAGHRPEGQARLRQRRQHRQRPRRRLRRRQVIRDTDT